MPQFLSAVDAASHTGIVTRLGQCGRHDGDFDGRIGGIGKVDRRQDGRVGMLQAGDQRGIRGDEK